MEKEKFDDLLLSVLKKWEETKDADSILNDNTGDLELSEENQQILEKVCKLIDEEAQKMRDLQVYKKEGGTRKEWLEEKIDDAFEKAKLSEEQKTQVVELVHSSIEKTTVNLANEGLSSFEGTVDSEKQTNEKATLNESNESSNTIKKTSL